MLSSSGRVEFLFLEQGAQTAPGVAGRLAEFLAGAQESLEIAIYDFHLIPEAAAPIVAAVEDLKRRGVAMRMVFNQLPPERHQQVDPPPARVDWDLVHRLGIPFRPVPGEPDLMHHKYVVRDGRDVWTGSTNWTTDSFTLEENVLVRVLGVAGLAADYRRDFEVLWDGRQVLPSGRFDTVAHHLARGTVRVLFSPGRGPELAHEIGRRIGAARRRVRIASPVITSGPVLGSLGDLVAAGRVDLAGIYDRTQMNEVVSQWAKGPGAWKIDAFRTVTGHGTWSSKVSTPWDRQRLRPHDFMHCKLTVADDTVFVGSFNLSHSGEANAENVLEIQDPATADLCAAFIDRLVARYAPPAAVRAG